jgi:hypothetical protein
VAKTATTPSEMRRTLGVTQQVTLDVVDSDVYPRHIAQGSFVFILILRKTYEFLTTILTSLA